jgi:hypothetical protein
MCLPAKPLDDAISERLLTAVTPLTIKLALAALTNLEERDKLKRIPVILKHSLHA